MLIDLKICFQNKDHKQVNRPVKELTWNESNWANFQR